MSRSILTCGVRAPVCEWHANRDLTTTTYCIHTSHIRFYSKKPEMVIYTADFTITGMTGTNKSGSNNNHDSGDNSDVGLGLQASASTSNISTVTATSTMSASTGDSSTLATSFQSGQHSHSGERPTGRRFSAERGLVKYVHVLWPALIGVALAL